MGLAFALLVLAGIASLVAWVWLVIIAFRKGLTGWGIALIVGFFIPFGPLAAIVFSFVHPDGTKVPRNIFFSAFALGLLGGGLLVSATRDALENNPELRDLQQQMQRAAAEQATDAAPTPPPTESEATPTPPPPPPAAPSRHPAPQTASASRAPAPAPVSTPIPAPPAAPETALGCPVRVELLAIGDPTPGQMRPLDLRLANTAALPVTEIKLAMDYLDARGKRLGGRSTVHSGDGPLAGPGKTGTFTMTAFQVPEFTTDIRLRVEGVGFGDHSRWPAEP